MLPFLVTSATRRRLLELLWARDGMGTLRVLAARANVAYAGAHREIKKMLRYGIVKRSIDANGDEIYAANREHPHAALLQQLVTTRPAKPNLEADPLRNALRGLGVPLAGASATDVPAETREAILVDGVRLAMRDPTVARVLAIAFWRLHDSLDFERLEAAARHARLRHAVGFFLALTAELAGDATLANRARRFRDNRVRTIRPFFELPATREADATAERRTPEIARAWGYAIDLDMTSMQSQFAKFTSDAAV